VLNKARKGPIRQNHRRKTCSRGYSQDESLGGENNVKGAGKRHTTKGRKRSPNMRTTSILSSYPPACGKVVSLWARKQRAFLGANALQNPTRRDVIKETARGPRTCTCMWRTSITRVRRTGTLKRIQGEDIILRLLLGSQRGAIAANGLPTESGDMDGSSHLG